jgi:hypothetical protein
VIDSAISRLGYRYRAESRLIADRFCDNADAIVLRSLPVGKADGVLWRILCAVSSLLKGTRLLGDCRSATLIAAVTRDHGLTEARQ